MNKIINGLLTGYSDQGQGKTILFVHGFPLNRRMWQPQIDGLSGQARILALDLRGHGESQGTSGVYAMELLAEDINQFLDALDIQEPIILCGLSMGGYISLAYSRKYPDRLAGLVLAATRSLPDSTEARMNRDKTAEMVKEQGIQSIVNGMLGRLLSPESVQHRPDLVDLCQQIMETISLEAVLGDLAGMKVRIDSTPGLQLLRVPTLVIHGSDDQIVPLSEAQQMAELIPHSKFVPIPHAGHLVNLEQPGSFNQAIEKFFQL